MKKIQVVAAIIIHDKEILCMQRGHNKYPYLSYKYEFPGGKIEQDEIQTNALMRELYEEMALHICITTDQYFCSIHHVYPDFEITMYCYICKVENRFFERKEHINHKWLSINDLMSVDWALADRPIVKKLMDGGIDEWI